MAPKLAKLLLGLLLGAFLAPSNHAAPNIVMVFVDDQGYSDISYNDDQMSTPNLKSIATEEGAIRLTNFYSGATCTPSRAMLMTGKFAIHIGMQDSVIHATEPRGVPLSETFVSEKLQSVGYTTVAIGKWHMGMHAKKYLPMQRGFDHHFGIYTGGGSHTEHLSVSQQFTPRTEANTFVYSGVNLWQDGQISAANGNGVHSTVLYTEYAVSMVEELSEEENPFFIYLAYQAIHDPMEAAYEESITETKCNSIEDEDRQVVCGMMHEIDNGVGKIRDALKEKGVWDNTLFIYASDNGGVPSHGSSNAPYRGEKATYWQGGVLVPAFVAGGYFTQSLPASMQSTTLRTYDGLFHLVDIHALMLGVSGYTGKATRRLGDSMVNKLSGAALTHKSKQHVGRSSDHLDGIDMWHVLTSSSSTDAPKARDELLINLNSDMFGGSAALIMGDYKYLINADPAEARIYSKVRTYIASQEEELMTSKTDFVTFVTDTANSVLSGEEYMFNIRKNMDETEDGTCDDPEECTNLIENREFAHVKSMLTTRLANYKKTAVESTFNWQDDGVLANPMNFQGVWQPWRDDAGEPLAVYLGSQQSLFERTDTSVKHSKSAKASSKLFSISSASDLLNVSNIGVLAVVLLVSLVSFRMGSAQGRRVHDGREYTTL